MLEPVTRQPAGRRHLDAHVLGVASPICRMIATRHWLRARQRLPRQLGAFVRHGPSPSVDPRRSALSKRSVWRTRSPSSSPRQRETAASPPQRGCLSVHATPSHKRSLPCPVRIPTSGCMLAHGNIVTAGADTTSSRPPTVLRLSLISYAGEDRSDRRRFMAVAVVKQASLSSGPPKSATADVVTRMSASSRWSEIEEAAQPTAYCQRAADRHVACHRSESVPPQPASQLGHDNEGPVQPAPTRRSNAGAGDTLR